MQKKRGSAILIAILLVAAIGSIAFSFGRVLYLQMTTASLYKNGTGAYYAAESGIEEGFLRYRYDRNAQIPIVLNHKQWLASNQTSLNNLSNLSVIYDSRPKLSYYAYIPTSQYYDVRMGSTSSTGTTPGSVSGDISAQPGSPYYISRDQTTKIDLGSVLNNSGSEIGLSFNPQNAITSGNPLVLQTASCVLVEAKLVAQETAASPVVEYKKLLKSNSGSCSYPPTLITNPASTVGYDYTSSGTVSGLKFKITGSSLPYLNATLFLKPIGADIAYALTETSDAATLAANPLNGGSSVIVATGYYGGVARTIEADIDRQNGSLYDLYDYVLFKGN